MNCPLCNTKLKKQVTPLFYLCSECHSYVKDHKHYYNSQQEFKHYQCHQNDVEDLGYQKFTSDITNAILKLCDSKTLGLDFGCGSAPVITHQLQKKGYTINLFDIYFHPDLNYQNYLYDYIFSCEVFEHLYHPNKEITALLQLLKPGGYLLIKTHLYQEQTPFEHWYYIKDHTHVFIYTKNTMAFIALKFDLEIIHLDQRLTIFKKK